MDELSPRQVTLDDAYWSPRLQVNAARSIFHQWQQLEASGCIDNFRIAAGEKDGFREGWFFADSDAYKWLDAAARISLKYPNEELSALMDDFIFLLGRAQCSDGYIFTYNQIHFPGVRWAYLQIEHELYCHGHLIEAGVSHYQATGRTDLLDLVCKAADRIVQDFNGAPSERTPGHEEIEIALLRLHQVTHRPAYFEMARHFLEQRGRSSLFGLSLLSQNRGANQRKAWVRDQRKAYLASHPEHADFHLHADNFSKNPPDIFIRYYFNAISGKFFQQHEPLRLQTEPVGHAVRFGYLETAAAMLLRERPEGELQAALLKTWERMVTRRMYVTGGLGSLPVVEGFGRDYELDPEYAYAETCAALASLFWNWEMALITREARFSDLFEWQLYNAAAVGLGLDGESYLYNNPLASRGGISRKTWYAVPCCPSNLSRTWASLEKYLCSVGPGEVWLHQYAGSRLELDPGTPLSLEVKSALPWQGKVEINLHLESPARFTLWLRAPSWAEQVVVRVNGEPCPLPDAQPRAQLEPTASGYDPRRAWFMPLQRTWADGDRVELDLDMPLVLRKAHPKVMGHQGKAAVTRGPLVYCLESVDNPEVDLFDCRLDPSSLQAEWDAEQLGGCMRVLGRTTDGQALTFIPYHLWANRGESQMTVWVNLGSKNS